MFILDTCTLLWYVGDYSKLSKRALDILSSEESVLYFSIASVWELGLKEKVNDIFIDTSTASFINEVKERFSIEILNISIDDCDHLKKLPSIHKDPFDRMLVAQAITNGFTIITSDKVINEYPCKSVW